MEKRPEITDTVMHLLEACTAGNRARVCVLMSRDTRIPKTLATLGHRMVVVGDRFKPLFHFITRNRPYNPVLAVEARYRELPLGLKMFDVLIVARPMPRGSDLGSELQRLQQYLRQGGTLMWIHPVFEGFMGRVRRMFASSWVRVERHQLCQTAMAEGFHQIGQEIVRGPGITRYVLTRATARQ